MFGNFNIFILKKVFYAKIGERDRLVYKISFLRFIATKRLKFI